MIMRMIVEGTIMLAGNRSPVFIRETLSSFSAHHDDELRSTGSSSGGKASTTQRSSMDDDF